MKIHLARLRCKWCPQNCQEQKGNGLAVQSSTREAVPERLQHSSVSDMIKKALIKSFNLKSNINTALC